MRQPRSTSFRQKSSVVIGCVSTFRHAVQGFCHVAGRRLTTDGAGESNQYLGRVQQFQFIEVGFLLGNGFSCFALLSALLS
jgi:hypothetical protein